MSIMSKVNVGIIGTGGIAKNHVLGYQKASQANVVAVCDNDKAKAIRFAREHKIPQVYSDYNEMLAKESLDAVSVCVPNFLHGPISVSALNSKIHVLCEKPIAHTVKDAEKMVAASKKNKKFLMIGYHNRFRGEAQVLKRYIDTGVLGEIYYAKTAYMRRVGIPGWGGWFTLKEKSGGGPLIDIGVHVLDLTLYMMGFPEPKSVVASTYAKFGPRGLGFWGKPVKMDVEDLGTGFIKFKNGATLTLECSWASNMSAGEDSYVRLYGTEGGAILDPPTIFANKNGLLTDTKLHYEKTEAYNLEVAHFIDSIVNNKIPISTGEQGLLTLRILDAMYRSANSDKQVFLK